SRPATMAIAMTKTTTTRAIPPAVIRVVTGRTIRLRALYFRGMVISGDRAKRLDDIASRRRAGGDDRADETDEDGHGEGDKEHRGGHLDGADDALHGDRAQQEEGAAAAEEPSGQRDEEGFREQHREDGAGGKADRAQHRDFGSALANRHGGGIGGDEADREDDEDAHQLGHAKEHAVAGDEVAVKGGFGLGQGFGRGVGEVFVKRGDDLGDVGGAVNPDPDDIDETGAAAHLFEIVAAKHEEARRRLAVEGADDIESDVERIDGAAQHDALTEV